MAFEKFRELMVIQMNMTAAEELTIKLDTRKLELSNNKLLEKIQGSYQTQILTVWQSRSVRNVGARKFRIKTIYCLNW